MTICDLRPDDDVEEIVAIAMAAWEPIWVELARRIGEELFAVTRADVRADKARQIRAACEPADGAGVAVAEIDGRIVGFVTYYAGVKSGMGSLGNNAVHPDYQGRGIAGLLYACAFDRLRSAGMRFVHVQTGLDPAHAPARRAYQKAGFDVVGFESVNYYRRL